MSASQEEAGTVEPAVLVAANEDAADFYRAQLLAPEHIGPRSYLTARGFAGLMGDTIWTVGYAPAGWTTLVDNLSGLGYSDATLLQSGLATRCRRGTLIDRFRDRLTFGIRNLDGELVGFTARCRPAADGTVPKYLNTPTTALYRKNEALFGLGEHADQLRNAATLVLVEGPLDAIAVAAARTDDTGHGSPAAGRYAPVALCGTALTDAHASQIAKLIASDVVVALDEDHAGQRAAENAYLQLARHTDHLHAPRPWKRNDPADILQASGPRGIREQLEHLTPLASQIITRRLATWRDLNNNAETDLAALREIAHLIAEARPRNVAPLARQLIEDLSLDVHTVNRELTEAAAPQEPVPESPRVNGLRAAWANRAVS
jgi:DNA primase